MTSAIILCAGNSARMVQNKLLMPIAGKPLVYWAVSAVAASRVEDIVIVLGRDAARVGQYIDIARAKLVDNNAYRSGQASSIGVGLKHLHPNSEQCFFVMGDQPFISAKIINALLDAHQKGHITRPVCGNRAGSPVLFDKRFYGELANLAGDSGGKAVIHAHPQLVDNYAIKDKDALIDIDHIADYQRCQALADKLR